MFINILRVTTKRIEIRHITNCYRENNKKTSIKLTKGSKVRKKREREGRRGEKKEEHDK